MKTGVFALLCLLSKVGVVAVFAQSGAVTDATLFRVFLQDGQALVSYGEVALVGDRVIFSMPISTPSVSQVSSAPLLQLVDLPLNRVDWPRTTRYAESARAAHYLTTRAVQDYARLTNEVAETLNEIARTEDSARRLAIVENARRRLAGWPADHYNFNYVEVQQLLAFLDEAIADLRAATGTARFNLNLVAAAAPLQPTEPLLAPPTLKEAIEQVLTAARWADSPTERASLLGAALTGIERDAGTLPSDWTAAMTAAIRAEIALEVQVDRQYQLLSQTSLAQAATQARAADVRGIQRLLTQIAEKDQAFGAKRPDVVSALIESVQLHLDAARQLQLARDHFAMRASAFRRYRTSLRTTFEWFVALRSPLEDIRALAGSTPSTLEAIERLAGQILTSVSRIKPPDEMQPAHALLVSAAQLAQSAAGIRREAARTANISKAWDASSAAAGALMLSARGQTEIQMQLRFPQLPQ